jgi:chromosome segregation ATPase
LVRSLVEAHNDFILCQLREAEATSDVEILQHKIEETLQMVNAKRTEYSRLKEAATQASNSARKLQNNCRRVLEELTPEDSDFMNNIPLEKTIEDIETDIEAEVARLELLHEGNPNAIKQFEERTAKIQNLKTKISARETDLETHAANITGIRNQWEPEVDRLVAKISSAFSKSFDKINCAGEVRMHKEDDDYEKWAVQILVKFREKEKLQVLDNRRQSGGERAVSTVFYLMALQSLARSPFRVVDEINQGMDPRNERLVHHRMVNIACQEFTSQ